MEGEYGLWIGIKPLRAHIEIVANNKVAISASVAGLLGFSSE
jgi:hypothetical protein